ncbi:MAG: hypothetical protein IKZ87_09135 [Actinomycetaceae bacterium]|nr:hypothetical protein [Actinomycetaceae bacterium]
MDLQGSIDLLKLTNACVATLGKTTKKRCVVIPIDDNDLYVKNEDNSTKPRSVYLGVNVWERQQPSQYGHTHYIKQSFSKAYREAHTEDEMKNKPFFGDMKPILRQNGATSFDAPAVEMEQQEQDDLPF